MTTVTVDQMRSKLLTLNQLRSTLGRSEPIAGIPFTVGSPITFSAQPGWNHGLKAVGAAQPVGVFIKLGHNEYQLTKNSVFEVCQVFGLTKNYVEVCPAELLVPQMNYWFREGLYGKGKSKTDFQLLVKDDGVVALTKQSLQPFSNLALLDQAVAAIEARHGSTTEILADFKTSHTLRKTSLRLIVPNGFREITSETPGDIWSTGIQIENSLTGASQTSIKGYLFRWVCTNGQIDARSNSGAITRGKDATEAEVYAWARQAVDEVLGGLEYSLDAVQSLTGLHIAGSLLTDTLRDIFEHYRIPVPQRTKIIASLEQYPGEITMYVIMNAITQVANEQGLESSAVDALLRVGGDIPHTADKRCGACHRLQHQH